MSNHKQVNININNQKIAIDEELANVIIRLNDLGYKTSGCCIGSQADDIEDEAWIIIQEFDEYKIVESMNRLYDCCYIISKELYKKRSDDAIYVQYVLKTPKGSYWNKVQWINDWFNKLNEVIISKVTSIKYKTMEQLFEKQYIEISFNELCSNYKDNWEVQYRFSNLDIWLDYDMVSSSLKSLIALNQSDVEWRFYNKL